MSVVFASQILFSVPLLTMFYQHNRGQYLERGTSKRFLSKDRASHSTFLFILVLRSNANRINTFSRIGDAKFKKLTGG